MSAEHRRLTLALLLSLLFHALLSSLTLGGQGLGLPGFGFPWQERRIEAPDLYVVLAPTPLAAAELTGVSVKEPLSPASIDQPVARRPALTPAVPLAPAMSPTAAASVTEATLTARAEPTPEAKPEPDTATVAAPAPIRWRTEATSEAAPTPVPEPIVIAAGRSGEAKVVVPAMPSLPTPVIAAAPIASGPQAGALAPRDAGDAAQKRIDVQARERAIELAKLDSLALEAQRQAAQLEAARAEAARQEAERQQAARQEAARQVAARQEAARAEVAQEDAARLERRRAMGRQLDEEAARREAASTAAAAAAAGPPSRLAPAPSGARRGRLFGRTDSNAELILYAEAWARKIQLNMTIDLVRDAAKRPHNPPLVTVAIRSDGSVESVTFVRPSGVAEIDEAIRRIVQSQVPYPAFPPALANEFDVIEIRRTWQFDMAVRLY